MIHKYTLLTFAFLFQAQVVGPVPFMFPSLPTAYKVTSQLHHFAIELS